MFAYDAEYSVYNFIENEIISAIKILIEDCYLLDRWLLGDIPLAAWSKTFSTSMAVLNHFCAEYRPIYKILLTEIKA